MSEIERLVLEVSDRCDELRTSIGTGDGKRLGERFAEAEAVYEQLAASIDTEPRG